MQQPQIQKDIMKLLDWDVSVYASFMYNCGLQYLEIYIGPDEEAINMLTPKQQYWNWWKNLFLIRDEAFLDQWQDTEIDLVILRRHYRTAHSPAILACEIHPPSHVYGNNFTKVKMAAV